ncbi:hypothetical protein JW964_11730 [candidate division KSB1 bacterium]|nr:hypothetical protein [candidate division KSB1 bacterium]
MDTKSASRYTKLNTQIRKCIGNLKFDAYKNLHGLVFSELCCIKYEELEDWIFEWAHNYCDVENLRNEIDYFFKRQGMKAICMYTLANKLRELCMKTLKS